MRRTLFVQNNKFLVVKLKCKVDSQYKPNKYYKNFHACFTENNAFDTCLAIRKIVIYATRPV